MLRFVQMMDKFGVEQKLQVSLLDPTQKSVLGGIVTVILYGASLAYFLFQIIDWQSNNKLPKYSTMKAKIDQNETIACPEVFAEIEYFQLIEDDLIDPFDPKNLIFQPILEIVPSDWDLIKPIDLDFIQEDQAYKIINKFLVKNITFQGQEYNSKKLLKIDYQFSLKYCNQSELDINQFVCANQTTIQNFLEQQNWFQITINIEQFDIKSQQLKNIPKQFVINMIEGQMQYQEFSLQVNSLKIDDGILFPSHKKINFFSDLQITSQQQFDANYSMKYYGQDYISVSYFQIDTLKEISILEYPKISEILANTGSIITFIMQISLLVSKYNEFLSVTKTKKEIIKMYYNDYGQYKIIQNWKGKIISVQRDGEIYKQKSIIDLFAKIDFTAGLKLNYINLQYELSKLQILVSSLLTAEQIRNYLKPQHLKSIGQLLSGVQGQDVRNTQNIFDQNFPSAKYLSKQNDKTDIDSEIIDENIKKSIGLFLINQDEKDEQEKLHWTFTRGENQAINIMESNIVR